MRRKSMARAEQLRLPSLRFAVLPFSVRRRSVMRATKQALTVYADVLAEQGFQVRALAEDQALLSELRSRSHVTARKLRGKPAARAAAFVASREGYRVHRMMEELSERISKRQESLLCG